MPVINIFGWHSHFGENYRPSAMKVFVDPIRQYHKVRTIPLGGSSYNNFDYNSLKEEPIVFFAMHPPAQLLEDNNFNITWVPMYDDVKWNRLSFWKKFPKSTKIIAYSKWISNLTIGLEFKTMRVKYFENPNSSKLASWDNGHNIFYWNRSGLLNKEQLKTMCDTLNAKTLIFRDHLDYYSHKKQKIILKNKIGNTDVINLDMYSNSVEYMEHLYRCNIFIAPRLYEGIGLTFLEAMANGMVVLSPNSPTMNEYIQNNINGVFLPYSELRRHYNRFVTKLSNKSGISFPIISVLPTYYNFNKLINLPLEKIGNNARKTHIEGYRKWVDTIPSIGDFILSENHH